MEVIVSFSIYFHFHYFYRYYLSHQHEIPFLIQILSCPLFFNSYSCPLCLIYLYHLHFCYFDDSILVCLQSQMLLISPQNLLCYLIFNLDSSFTLFLNYSLQIQHLLYQRQSYLFPILTIQSNWLEDCSSLSYFCLLIAC